MGPDPDNYTHGSDPDHNPIHSDGDVSMSDDNISSCNPHVYPQNWIFPGIYHFWHTNPFVAATSEPASASTSLSTSALTTTSGTASGPFFISSSSSSPSDPLFPVWTTYGHDNFGAIHDAPVDPIEFALEAIISPSSMPPSPYDSENQLEELEVTNPSGISSIYSHDEALLPLSTPAPQSMSLDTGSWPTVAPGPDLVPSAPPNQVQSVNSPSIVSHQLQLSHTFNLQDHQDEGLDAENEDQLSTPSQPPIPPQHGLSFPNPNSLSPENPQLFMFLRRWAHAPYTYPVPYLYEVAAQEGLLERVISNDDLKGDQCDMQGLNWAAMGISRKHARARRMTTYKNYVNRPRSDDWQPLNNIAHLMDFYRFRRMHIKRNIHLAHFQLRNVLSCVSRCLAFYPVLRGVYQINPLSGRARPALNLKEANHIHISTLSAKYGTLAVGGFSGDYYIKSLDSIHDQESGYFEGQLTTHSSGITNHVQIYQDRRSGSPYASFASNDMGFRTLDIASQKIVSESMFDFPINCTAISPDKRLRVMVGDDNNVLIVNSENNKVLQRLQSHRDFGFACDWSEDGWTVATGFQDMMVKIWDARRWTDSGGNAKAVTTIRAKMAGARSLRFSPLGSGKPVLVAAEEADFINILDTETFLSRQTVDIFGEIGGIDFTNDGRDLMVLCCDQNRGGLLRLERTKPAINDLYDLDTGHNDLHRGIVNWNRTRYIRRQYFASCPVDVNSFL